MTLINVQVQDGETFKFQSGASAQHVFDVLSMDDCAGNGTLTNKNGVLIRPQDVLTTENGPYLFRRLKGGVGPCIRPDSTQDLSTLWCQQLLSDPITHPPDLADLEAFLSSVPSAQLPIQPDVYGQLPSSLQQNFIPAYGALARAFTNSIFPPPFGRSPAGGASERTTILMEHNYIVAPLLTLDAMAGPLRVGMLAQRDNTGDPSKMTVESFSGTSLRPDGMLRDVAGFHVLAKWENRRAGCRITDAVEDLHSKTAAWTPLFYGAIKYLPCFVAVGTRIQFYALPAVPHGTPAPWPQPISGCFDTEIDRDRVRLLFHCVQFYKLLKAQLSLYPYPYRALEVDNDLVSHIDVEGFPEGMKRTIYFSAADLFVRKRIEPWSAMEHLMGVNFADIQQLYRETAHAPGLVHAVTGPELTGDQYNVTLAPLGREAQHETFNDESVVQRMAHGLLHGLAAIHEVKFVHRDVRIQNTACSAEEPRRWFLLDLECCAKDGCPAPPLLRSSHVEGVLVDGCFTAASDLTMLGNLLWKYERVVTSAEGRQFLGTIHVPAVQQQGARDLLLHPWIRCKEALCEDVGARPMER